MHAISQAAGPVLAAGRLPGHRPGHRQRPAPCHARHTRHTRHMCSTELRQPHRGAVVPLAPTSRPAARQPVRVGGGGESTPPPSTLGAQNKIIGTLQRTSNAQLHGYIIIHVWVCLLF